MEQILPSLAEPQSFLQRGIYSTQGLSWALSVRQRARWAWSLPPWSCQSQWLYGLLGAMNVIG